MNIAISTPPIPISTEMDPQVPTPWSRLTIRKNYATPVFIKDGIQRLDIRDSKVPAMRTSRSQRKTIIHELPLMAPMAATLAGCFNFERIDLDAMVELGLIKAKGDGFERHYDGEDVIKVMPIYLRKINRELRRTGFPPSDYSNDVFCNPQDFKTVRDIVIHEMRLRSFVALNLRMTLSGLLHLYLSSSDSVYGYRPLTPEEEREFEIDPCESLSGEARRYDRLYRTGAWEK